MPKHIRRSNATRSSVLACVEHVFGHEKRPMASVALAKFAPPAGPPSDGGLRLARPGHDRMRPKPPGRQKDNLGPPDRLLSRVPVRDDLLKPSSISRRNRDGSSRSHAPGSHAETPLEIPNTNFIRSDTTTRVC